MPTHSDLRSMSREWSFDKGGRLVYVFHERRQIELPETMTQVPVGVRAVLKQREKTRTGTFKGKSQEKYIKNGHILEKWVEFAVKKKVISGILSLSSIHPKHEKKMRNYTNNK